MSRGFARLLIKPGATELADLFECASVAEAVGHALGNPAVDVEAIGDVARVKGPRQIGRQHAAEVGCRAEFVDGMDFQKVLILDFVVVVAPPTAATVARVAVLFDFDEQHFEREPLVGEDAREVNQFVKDIEQRALLGAAATGNDLAALPFELDQMFADDDRFDDKHVVLFEQRPDFVANGRQRRELNFDELPAADHIDAIAAEALLSEAAGGGVAVLQLAVEGSFHAGRTAGCRRRLGDDSEVADCEE